MSGTLIADALDALEACADRHDEEEFERLLLANLALVRHETAVGWAKHCLLGAVVEIGMPSAKIQNLKVLLESVERRPAREEAMSLRKRLQQVHFSEPYAKALEDALVEFASACSAPSDHPRTVVWLLGVLCACVSVCVEFDDFLRNPDEWSLENQVFREIGNAADASSRAVAQKQWFLLGRRRMVDAARQAKRWECWSRVIGTMRAELRLA